MSAYARPLVVLVVSFGLVIAGLVGSASGHDTNNIHHTLDHLEEAAEEIKEIVSVLPDDPASIGEVQAARDEVLSAFPADPALARHVAAASEEIVAAVGDRGFVRGLVVSHGTCETVVPEAPSGIARLATITILTIDVDGMANVQLPEITEGVNGYIINTTLGHPETFVETAPPGVSIRVCNAREASMFVNAQWTEAAA